MAINGEASPICRGKNLTWETVLLFFNNMPKSPMPKTDFHTYIEQNINGWTQTHSQIARQLAFYYENEGICYPRFTAASSIKDLIEYMEFWACNYFIPNPYTPSLSGRSPVNIYSFLCKKISNGINDFDSALDSIFSIPLNSHDKINVFLSDFTNIIIDEKHVMRLNPSINISAEIKEPSLDSSSDNISYFNYFNYSNNEDIRAQFEFYLRNCVNSIRNQENNFRYGNSAIASYLSYTRADLLFAYNREKWNHIKESLFEITLVSEIEELTEKIIKDQDFVNYERDRGQWGIKTIMVYNAFLHARNYFSKYSNTNSINENSYVIKERKLLPNTILQQIFYGAPGTGKSYGIDVETIGKKVIRTTFHPDSDYSTFVGAYKPVMREVPTMTVIGTKSVPVEDGKGNPVVEKKIEYDFIPQAFTEAYVEAWKDLKKPVYLVIEEINRGNCAQIFGDIFQLLDRDDNGFSSYMISPDEDLHRHLEETFAEDGFDEDCPLDKSDILEIWEGKKMCLPPNLYIWATMNTSDQSLFPIDSAFKRRWDWKYTPISDAGKGYHIDVNGNSYDWWSFLEKVNEIVEEMTSSEDKQLGYFFCKAEDGKISAEKFVGKVIFYLWNDVFKDYGFDRDEFKYEENGKKKPLTFRKFFNADGKINEEMAEKFLTNLGLNAITISDKAISQEEEEALEEDGDKKEGKHDFIKAVTLDGYRISTDDMTHFDVYMETLRRIGIAQVAPLIESCKFKRKKCPLASTVKFDAIENASNYSYVQEEGYYFVKGAADKTLINVLNMLKTELSLDLEIEIYR